MKWWNNREKNGMDYRGYMEENRMTHLVTKYKPHRRRTLGEPRKR
jgi:hypothetical protein